MDYPAEFGVGRYNTALFYGLGFLEVCLWWVWVGLGGFTWMFGFCGFAMVGLISGVRFAWVSVLSGFWVFLILGCLGWVLAALVGAVRVVVWGCVGGWFCWCEVVVGLVWFLVLFWCLRFGCCRVDAW